MGGGKELQIKSFAQQWLQTIVVHKFHNLLLHKQQKHFENLKKKSY